MCISQNHGMHTLNAAQMRRRQATTATDTNNVSGAQPMPPFPRGIHTPPFARTHTLNAPERTAPKHR